MHASLYDKATKHGADQVSLITWMLYWDVKDESLGVLILERSKRLQDGQNRLSARHDGEAYMQLCSKCHWKCLRSKRPPRQDL